MTGRLVTFWFKKHEWLIISGYDDAITYLSYNSATSMRLSDVS